MFPVVLYQYTPSLFFQGTSIEIKLHSFFVLSLPLHLMENFFTTIFNFNEFVFAYVVIIRFICDGKIYLLTYLLIYKHIQNDVSVVCIWCCSLTSHSYAMIIKPCCSFSLEFLQQCLLVWSMSFKDLSYKYHLKDITVFFWHWLSSSINFKVTVS